MELTAPSPMPGCTRRSRRRPRFPPRSSKLDIVMPRGDSQRAHGREARPLPALTITKLDAAKRQLCTAIRMFFADDDAIAVCTLANAALEIFEGRPKKVSQRGAKTRLFDIFKTTAYQNLSKKEAWDRVHKAKNFFKHGGSLQESVVFHEETNDGVLLFACMNCAEQTAPAQPAEVEAFFTWLVATQAVWPDPVEPQPPQRRMTMAEIDAIYPGVRTASPQEKKRFGTKLIADAVAGRLAVRLPGGMPLPTGACLSPRPATP
jgi:hypothetical protein